MSHKILKCQSITLLNVKNVKILIKKCQKCHPKNPKMSKTLSATPPHFTMAFSHSVYLGLSFQVVSSELVISVCQNVVTSEYPNFCCVKVLDCYVGILDGKFRVLTNFKSGWWNLKSSR